jgi:hypothetical protein
VDWLQANDHMVWGSIPLVVQKFLPYFVISKGLSGMLFQNIGPFEKFICHFMHIPCEFIKKLRLEMEMHSIAWIDELCNAIKSSESCLGQNSESSASESDMSQFSRLDDYDESEMEDSYVETFSKKRI